MAPDAHSETPAPRVRRIRKASEQVADQLRALILGGELPAGAKLPTEQLLAADFGVSRATVREALTGLSTEGLLRTVKGVNGGSFVTTPTPDRVSDALNLAVTLLSQTNGVTLADLLEIREYLEIPAARRAPGRARRGRPRPAAGAVAAHAVRAQPRLPQDAAAGVAEHDADDRRGPDLHGPADAAVSLGGRTGVPRDDQRASPRDPRRGRRRRGR